MALYYRKNDTEQGKAVTIPIAPCTNCQRALPAKRSFCADLLFLKKCDIVQMFDNARRIERIKRHVQEETESEGIKKGSVMRMGKPGIMMYFEIYPCLELMTREEKGDMLDAMMYYGMTGKKPKLSGNLKILWPLLKDRLDRDTDRYNRIVVRNQYASYAKSAQSKNQQALTYEEWLEINYPNGIQSDE